MAEHEEQEPPKVKVVDRRRFVMDEAGDVVERPDAPRRETAPTPSVPPTPPSAPSAPRGAGVAGAPSPAAVPPSGGAGIAGAPGGGTASAGAGAAAAPGATAAPAAGVPTDAHAEGAGGEEERVLTQIFLEFLNSLAHSMLVHLGEVPDPGSGLVRENLEGAQQTLEVLSVLRRKTEGNLSAQEARVFDSMLYELMMRFRQKVEAMQRPPGVGGPVPGGRP